MWEAFCQFMATLLELCYPPVHDWGMAILIFTVIFRLALTPLISKQTKSSYQMQKVQPLLSQIQERFADDPVRQQEELQKVYAEAKFNPLAGCLPMLLQMPIFMAFFTVLRNIDTYITSSTEFTFYNLIPDLLLSPADTFAQGFNTFLPYLILMIVFAGATIVPMIIQQKNNQNSSQRTQMIVMSIFMMLMMVWIGWGSPGGVLLYWGLASLIGIFQQQIIMHSLKKKDKQIEEAEAETKLVEVDVERRVKKKRPKKKR